jgi:hypothetical protein
MISSAHYEEGKKEKEISQAMVDCTYCIAPLATCPADPQNRKRDQKDKEKGIKRKAGDAISVGSNAT